MKEEIETNAVMPSGSLNKTGVFSLEQLEKALSREIAVRVPLHYDELCRKDELSKIRAVRSENGRIDVMGTFTKAWKAGNAVRGGYSL